MGGTSESESESLYALEVQLTVAKCEFDSLTDLLKGSTHFVWSPLCHKAFEDVKSVLCLSPVLSAPHLDCLF